MLTRSDKLTFREKRKLRVNERRILVDALQIGLASPQEIRHWAERSLPDGKKIGRVTSPKTVDYKTLKPVKDGLFCERIFGPVKDFICACGKTHRVGPSKVPIFCGECGVEVTKSTLRRNQLGYIQLASPVVHVWYLKDRIGYIATLLGKKKKSIDRIAYCKSFVFDYILPPPFQEKSLFSEKPLFLASSTESKKDIEKEKTKQESMADKECNPLKSCEEGDAESNLSPLREGTDMDAFSKKDDKITIPDPYPYRFLRGKVTSLEGSIGRGCLAPFIGRERGSLSLVPSFEERGDIFSDTNAFFSLDNSLINQKTNSLSLEEDIPFQGVASKAKSKMWQVTDTFQIKEKTLSDSRLSAFFTSNPFFSEESIKSRESVKSKSGSIDVNKVENSRWGWYSQSHVFPFLPTHACDLLDRPILVEFFTKSPLSNDRAIPWYSAISRDYQKARFHDLVTNESAMPSWSIERVLRHTGGEALQNLIRRVDISLLDKNLVFDIQELERAIDRLLAIKYRFRSENKVLAELQRKHAKQIRRLKVIRLLLSTNRQPGWMIISCLPVLPPDLRPIIRLDDDIVVASDLNKLYQKVLFRNNRLELLRIVDPNTIGYTKRLLQEAVDVLLDGGRSGSRALSPYKERPLKSLSDSLKGKRGRFRQNLLGKRVDYSGRSVIVVGPNLRLQECGLPKEMAIKLFQPFLTRQLMIRKIATNTIVAKRFIASSHPIVWHLLSDLMKNHPVLLNRAPTLHRLGVQAFQPKLIGGRAILLHPLVCTAFNADFDGDQMAVHIPLSFQSRGEAWKLMWSRNHLLSPATGQPIIAPTQDMVLGCYYLTTNQQTPHMRRGARFVSSQEALRAYFQGYLTLQTPIWFDHNGSVENGNPACPPLEVRVDKDGKQVEICTGYQLKFERGGKRWGGSIRTTPGRLLFNENIF